MRSTTGKGRAFYITVHAPLALECGRGWRTLFECSSICIVAVRVRIIITTMGGATLFLPTMGVRLHTRDRCKKVRGGALLTLTVLTFTFLPPLCSLLSYFGRSSAFPCMQRPPTVQLHFLPLLIVLTSYRSHRFPTVSYIRSYIFSFLRASHLSTVLTFTVLRTFMQPTVLLRTVICVPLSQGPTLSDIFCPGVRHFFLPTIGVRLHTRDRCKKCGWSSVESEKM